MSTFYTEPTTGTQIATDVVGTDRYQIMKLDIGAPGSSIPATGTLVNGLLVDVSRIQGLVSVAQAPTSNPWGVSGTVSVVGPLSVTVSGTPTVNQGTSPWIVSGGVSLGSPIPPGSNIIGKVSQDTSPWIIAGNLTSNVSISGATNIGVLSSIASAIPPALLEGKLSLLSTDLAGNLRTTLAATNILNETTIATRHNQIEVNFSQPTFDGSAVTNTTAGGGTATQSNGEGVYATSTAATAGASGVSVQTSLYRPASESYAYFTAAFTTPTASSSFQRIGIYTASDGFYIGYNGTVLQAVVRQNFVDAGTAQASFNTDKLDGLVGSKFTRIGVLEAIDWTKLNVFRIRWSWFGAAPIVLEVLSPDGIWVIFHTIRQPNTSNLPSLTQSNLNMQVEVSKTSSDGTNLILRTACWAAGMTVPEIKLNDTITDSTLAQVTRSVIAGHTTAGGGSYINVKVSPAGSVQIGGTLDAITNPVPVFQSAGPWGVSGTVSASLAIPQPLAVSGTVATATDAAPTYTEGAQVSLSTNLDGELRVNTGADVVNRNGYDAQIVYDNTNRKILDQILQEILELSRKMFEL